MKLPFSKYHEGSRLTFDGIDVRVVQRRWRGYWEYFIYEPVTMDSFKDNDKLMRPIWVREDELVKHNNGKESQK